MKANPVARDLRSPKYRMRVVEPGKGKGSYKRRDKHEQAEIYSEPVIQSTHQQDEAHRIDGDCLNVTGGIYND